MMAEQQIDMHDYSDVAADFNVELDDDAVTEDVDTEGDEPEVDAEEASGAEEAHGEPEDDGAEGDEGAEEAQAEDVIEVAGEKVPLDDLKTAYLQRDVLQQQMQQVQELEAELRSQSEQFMYGLQAVAEALHKMLPPPPDPQLAQVDPAAYTQAQAQYDAAKRQVDELLNVFAQAGQMAQQAYGQAQEADVEREAAVLLQKMPDLKDSAKMAEFLKAAESAAEKVGFSADELEGVTDHRLYLLAYWAAKGMESQKRAKQAKQKVKPSRMSKQRRRQAQTPQQRRKLLKRLQETGDLDIAAQLLED